MAEFLACETPDFMYSELLSADTMNSFSSANQMKFIVKAGSIAALGY